MPPKKKKELVRFRSRLQDKRRRQNRFAAKEWASKLAGSDRGSYYSQEKWLKDDKAPEKPVETTAESSFTGFLAASSQARDEVTRGPAPYKIRTTVLKFYCSGKEASRKTPGSGVVDFSKEV